MGVTSVWRRSAIGETDSETRGLGRGSLNKPAYTSCSSSFSPAKLLSLRVQIHMLVGQPCTTRTGAPGGHPRPAHDVRCPGDLSGVRVCLKHCTALGSSPLSARACSHRCLWNLPVSARACSPCLSHRFWSLPVSAHACSLPSH
mgnify:CR=1 FL=1